MHIHATTTAPFRCEVCVGLCSFSLLCARVAVEIPGDVQSTCGSESSHEHFDGDLSFERGYEYKLMHEARQRNPDIRIYALEWSVPGWVGGTNSSIHDAGVDYSTANRKYTVDWLRGARDRWNITCVNFLGFWNGAETLALACARAINVYSCESEIHWSTRVLLIAQSPGNWPHLTM